MFALDGEIDELVGHIYLFLKEQLELSTMPPPSGILHGTMIGASSTLDHFLTYEILIGEYISLFMSEQTANSLLAFHSYLKVYKHLKR